MQHQHCRVPLRDYILGRKRLQKQKGRRPKPTPSAQVASPREPRRPVHGGEAPALGVPGLQCEGCQLRHGNLRNPEYHHL